MNASNLIFENSCKGAGKDNKTCFPQIIRILRKHLGMDIAFLAEFNPQHRVIKLVDTDEKCCPLKAGCFSPLEETYCKLIVDKKLPNILPDVDDFPLAKNLTLTKTLDIKSYIATPVKLPDGTLYGTLCFYSHTSEPALNKRDLAMLSACAEITALEIDNDKKNKNDLCEVRERINSVFSPGSITIKYQPIVSLKQNVVVGFEALSRFKNFVEIRPDLMFRDAKNIGVGPELEMKAIEQAIDGLNHFKEDIYLSVNASPDTILSPLFKDLFNRISLDRIILEITEHSVVELYHLIKATLEPLRRKGMRLAIDDAGAGFSSFRHIIELAPDIIKLDWSLTKNVDSDPSRRALVAAFVQFSEDTNSKLISEGIETAEELHEMQELGIEKAQGYLLGKPMLLHEAIEIIH